MKYEKPITVVDEYEVEDVIATSNGSLDNGNEYGGEI